MGKPCSRQEHTVPARWRPTSTNRDGVSIAISMTREKLVFALSVD